MQCDRPLGAIVPDFTVRLAHSFQDGDDRLIQHDRLLSAIVSLSRSDRPIPSRMATNVLCSAIGPSAPSYLASRFGSPIPSRMATTVLCSTIGFSAPSCLFHVRIAHSFQDGDDRLMRYDRPLSAIVPSSRSVRPSLPGWRRTSYASRSASQRHRVSFTFGSPHSLQDGDKRLMQCDRPLGAIVHGFTVRLAHSLQDGDDRLMQHDRLLSAIVSLSRSDRPIPSRMATNVLCSAIGPSAPSYLASRSDRPIPSRMAT
ncbi:unnamed protein product, partial [Cuscuta epithymum]